MEYNKYYEKKKMEKIPCFKHTYEYNEDDRKNFGIEYMNPEFLHDELTRLNIFTIIKNEIINVLSVIKKHEYNKNLDSSIVDALFILYNSISNLTNSLKEEIDIHEFNNKLDIYHIAPFLNIIRNNNIFYRIKLNALHSLDHILKYNSSYFNETMYDENVSRKQESYISIQNDQDMKINQNDHLNIKELNDAHENSSTKVNEERHDDSEVLSSKMSEKMPKRKKYNFFSKNYKLSKKFSDKKEDNSDLLINKGNNIINVSIETLLCAPINYNNINHEEIILYDTIILFNNMLFNAIRVVDRKNIIKIICYIFKIYKNNKYSLLFKGNCESILKNIFYIVMNNLTSSTGSANMRSVTTATASVPSNVTTNELSNACTNQSTNTCGNNESSADDELIHDLLTIILILMNSNKNKFVEDLLKTKECIGMYNDLFENEISNDNMECINVLSFRLLNILLETCGYALINKNFDALSNIIRCLFLHITSSSYILMCRSMRTYINIFILYKKHFCIYNEVFINILLSILKNSSSKNVTETALLTLSYFCLENVLFEIYYNHDVNLYASDLLENFIRAVLDLCVNFINNTTIMNDVIFKMVKNILHIIIPCVGNCITSANVSNNKSGNNVLNDQNNRMGDIGGYTNQLINEFRNDLYSDIFGYVIHSGKIELLKGASGIRNWREKSDEKRKIQKEKKKKKLPSEESGGNKCTTPIGDSNESSKGEKKKEQTSQENDSKKNSLKHGEGTENAPEKEESKKSNMNELYSLNFLTSNKDKRYVLLCSILLCEYVKESIKVDYIKNKEHLMRKKKIRKEILKKAATIFNTLKNKSIDELIKMKMIQTEETFIQGDKNDSILHSLMTEKREHFTVYSNQSYDEKSHVSRDMDTEKVNSDKSNGEPHLTASKNSDNNANMSNSRGDVANPKTYITSDTKSGEKGLNSDAKNPHSAMDECNGELIEDEVKQFSNHHKGKDTLSGSFEKGERDNSKVSDEKRESLSLVESSGRRNASEGTDYDTNAEEAKASQINSELVNTKNGENDLEEENKKQKRHSDAHIRNVAHTENGSSQNMMKRNSVLSNAQRNLMEDPHFLKSIAKFLRYNPFLDKEYVGEYISHRKNINILKSYVRLFDFCNLSLLSSLRLFLYCFKLPGEAQLIERILEHFSLCFFYSNPICGDLDRVYREEGDKVECLLKDEELANTKRYILIDFLNDNSHEGGSGDGSNNKPSESGESKHTDGDTACQNKEGSPERKRKKKKNSSQHSNVQEKINLKKDVDMNDYIHRNVYSMSKKIQLMSEEEVQKKYVLVENSDVIFILTYSIIMLNTDLHNNQVKNKMKLEEFIKNNRGINNGKNIDRIYLENLYNCILHEEIKLFSNTQSTYTNDNQYWKLLEKRKEQYKNYHSFKAKEVYFYKFDINKLLIKNNFIPIFFEIFKRTQDYNLTENCLSIFKMAITNFAYYHDVENINKLCYIFKYINFYLTQKSQSLLYLLFHVIKRCHNLFREGWVIYINVLCKLITIDLVPIFFYPHMYINNAQFNNDKDSLHRKYKKGNCVETYNINKNITEIYQHPFLMFKKNIKKMNKPKWIDEFSSMFFFRHSNNENSNLSMIFKESYSEKLDEDKKKRKKKDKTEEHANKEKNNNTSIINGDIKQTDDGEDDDEEDDDDSDNDDSNDEDNLNHIYVHLKVDPKNVDNSSIMDSVTIYKRLKLDVYNFFTINDFYNNMITNLNITSFIYLVKILMIKCSLTKHSEQHNVAPGNRTDLHNSSLRMQIIPNHNYMTNDKSGGIHNTHENINDSNPVLINADNSFDLFCNTKEKLLTSQMLFHIIYFKINYTYVLYNMICRMGKKSATRIFKERGAQEKCGKMSSPINLLVEESLRGDIHPGTEKNEDDKKKKKNRYDLTLDNIYDTDNSTNVTSSDSEFSDISSDSFFIRKNDLIIEENRIYGDGVQKKEVYSQEGQGETCKDMDEFDKIYSYAHDDDGGSEDACDEASSDDSVDSSCDERNDAEADCEPPNVNNMRSANTHIANEMMHEEIHSKSNPNKCIRTDKEKNLVMDKIKMNLYIKTYIMHLKITVITFEHFFNLLNKFLLINYDSSIFVSIYNSIFKDYQMEDLNFVTEEDITNDHKLSYQIYEESFENIDKKLHYKGENVAMNDIEKNLFLIKIPKAEGEEDWLFIEHLIMSIINFSYICFSIYKDDKHKMSKKETKKSSSVYTFPDSSYAQLREKNGKFFFLCGIYLMYILQFLKKNILYRFIDKIIYMLEKISKNVYVNSCIINIYLHMLQLITPNNILYKNTNNTNISLNDKDIYIYIEKATIYTESINNIINNNNVLLKLNNFNIENIILSLLPYLLYFNNKKEEINAHIASINSECLHIISNIYYKSTYMYMNNQKRASKQDNMEGSWQDDNYNSSLYRMYNDNISFEKIIELKKMYIFLLICFVLSLACSFSSKRTRSEAYIKLQQFLFNENYIFKKVKNPNGDNSPNMGNNKSEKNSKQEKYVYRDEKLIDLISNFIILPLITYNYYFPFICKSVHWGQEANGGSKSCINEAQCDQNEPQDTTAHAKNNYCKEALLNFNLYNKRNNDISSKMWKRNEYENCGCIINYKNIETVDQDLNVLTSLFNYANDYYIHTMLHKQYNYYFSYLYAKKLLSYDNVCYRKSMSISFVSHIILSFLHSLLNYAGDGCENSDEGEKGLNNGDIDPTKGKNDSTSSDDCRESHDINLYDLLCLNNDKSCNKIVTKTKCENNCIFYFLKHFYHALLTIKEETKKILNIYKETFIENIKNIIYVSSSYAYCLKDHHVNCFSHIKNGYSFLNEEEKKLLKSYNLEGAEKVERAENMLEGDKEVFNNILKLQVNVRISVVIVYYILYTDNNQNEQFKSIFEELLNVLLAKYSVKSESLDNGADPNAESKKADDQTEQKQENLPNDPRSSEESAGTAELDKKEEPSDQTAGKEKDDANLQTGEQNEEDKE
ncbi:protein transport protein SEC7, putative [Plasmodium knowlesi strain H]|uniref:Protein transport protein SEC7, putative n=3 Tax=Plasmodium knowlesi TaxID=5850 RepID=A0A5K1U9K1_PLAKH|nr:protein transport protein SEC7, putative [Plasmodium knowlesi strain H]OTN65294.1 putative Guanine-nucleotide-exchange-factor [Plasmodium knowlesi]CAA9989721.1 protein transport protein SEC7, putative [Plasmodium knowlesi strain H]SBO22875.1 protein transport protein SEC7, putative [Plasmodium knowlesi strain H]SBO23026.1 protein transport protein SEC7, putative [Plasmodium knowlesi strain H]VVS79195.1 protein transport protein SEC7, putative [Plasmodium knowlesi strain H]|eukprot:XP_002260444.1 guanine-nucleotide-exchange-factor, putative [Plasmodium knowlesi strain H]